jgi:glycosyltransferase involved in cell wall biosynthesis
MASISYCVSVCNEHLELDKLLNQLVNNFFDEDEIIILVDQSKATTEVGQVIAKYKAILNGIKVIGDDLNGDFASFKNQFMSQATKEYIFQIDADELLSESVLLGTEDFGDLRSIIEMNPEVDLYFIPRENYVPGITQDHINKWGWKVDEKGRINWRDPQARIFKNNGLIKWKNKVHEVIIGHKTVVLLPDTYFIIHVKNIERQEKQNQFYSTL